MIAAVATRPRGRLTANAPLAPLIWFKTGGAAESLFEPDGTDDLADFVAGLPVDVPLLPLGLGSNLMVRDGGVAGGDGAARQGDGADRCGRRPRARRGRCAGNICRLCRA